MFADVDLDERSCIQQPRSEARPCEILLGKESNVPMRVIGYENIALDAASGHDH